MPWHELPDGGWSWERPGADPVTQILPVIPPLASVRVPAYVPPAVEPESSGLPVGVRPLPRLPGNPGPGGGAVPARLVPRRPAPDDRFRHLETGFPAVASDGDALLGGELLPAGGSERVGHPPIVSQLDLPPTAEYPAPLGPPSFPSLDPPLPYEKRLVAPPTQEKPVRRRWWPLSLLERCRPSRRRAAARRPAP